MVKFGIILVLFTLGSCEEILDVVPSDRISVDRLLQKQTNLAEFRNNCYDQVDGSMINQSSAQLLEVFTDDAFRRVGIHDSAERRQLKALNMPPRVHLGFNRIDVS